MKRILLLSLLSALVTAAYAQTTSNITSQACNVALSQCTATDSNADTLVVQGQWVYSGPVTLSIVTAAGAQPTKSCLASRTSISHTNYKIVDDLSITCDDGSTLSGTYTATRSGSGRGGWAWHPHVFLESLTRY
nr:hypothetical protein [uncultured Roseateles sp.]